MNLKNTAGREFSTSYGHWAVYLTLAQAFGWKPAGTTQPRNFQSGEKWNGQYATSDGQFVEDGDAKILAEVLHAAALSPKLPIALTDVIGFIEAQTEKSGLKIPAEMRMDRNDFSKEFSPLLEFLYQGGFYIE